MFEEVLIFGGHHGVDQVFGNLVIANHHAILAIEGQLVRSVLWATVGHDLGRTDVGGLDQCFKVVFFELDLAGE